MSLPAPFRFALEAAVLVAVGVALAAAELALLPFVLLMGAAWILVATGERVLSRPPDDGVPAVWQPPPERREDAATVWHVPKPTSEAPRRPEPEPQPAEQFERGTSQEQEQEPEPEPEPERALEVVPDPQPEPEPEQEEYAEPIVELPQAAHRRPEGWNLWDLEQRAHQLSGRDPSRDEEWSALFFSLRDFARPDGTLPHEFDALVAESFGELTSRRS
jgi:outer membrane biosynthesis protein TonB